MARLGLAGIAVGAVVAVLLAPSASSQPGARSVKCGGGPETILFWPRGHGQLKTPGFSAYPTPHVEVYRGGAHRRGYPTSDFRGFLDSFARSSVARRCKRTPLTTASPGIKNRKRTMRVTRLECTLPAGTSIMEINAAGSADLRIRQGSRLLVDVHMAAQGSRMLYDGGKCRAKAPPA